LEDLARRDWITAQAASDVAMKELEGLYAQIEQARFRAAALQKAGGAHSTELGQIDDFIRGQKIRIEAKRAELRLLLGEVERCHELLLQASIETKTLEKLKERRLAEFKLKRKKRELKEVDELIVTRARSQQFEASEVSQGHKVSGGVKAK